MSEFDFSLKRMSAPEFPPVWYPGPLCIQDLLLCQKALKKENETKYIPLLSFPDSWSAAQHPCIKTCVWSCQELLSARIHTLSSVLVCCVWVSCFWLLKNLSLKWNHRINEILFYNSSPSQQCSAMFLCSISETFWVSEKGLKRSKF